MERFHRDGFVLVKGALGSGECEALRVEIDLAMEEYPSSGLTRWIRSQMFLRGAVFEELLDHPPVFDVAERLLRLERGDKRTIGG